METPHPTFTAALHAWQQAATLRAHRTRLKNYTYGNQWADPVRDDTGNWTTEGQMIAASGRKPLTNNLIRRMVKTIVGRYRATAQENGRYTKDSPPFTAANSLHELDARMLEEFLISGCAIQRIGMRRPSSQPIIDNISPSDFFVNPHRDPRGNDIELIGVAHTLSLQEILRRFSPTDPLRARQIARIYQNLNKNSGGSLPLGGNIPEGSSTLLEAPPGMCRLIETWTLETTEQLLCHDPVNAKAYTVPTSQATHIQKANAIRRATATPAIKTRWKMTRAWHYRFFTPTGHILAQGTSPYPHASHPFVIKLYPLTDGEIHPFVEDLIDQQRYINRLIVSIDHTMQSSAKGVLLYPVDQLPPGLDLAEVARRWSAPDGLIPINGRNSQMPAQVVTKNNDTAAYQLLALQMKLFEDVSGVTDAMMGKASASNAGANLYDAQVRNATIALADIFATFESFIDARDAKASTLTKDSGHAAGYSSPTISENGTPRISLSESTISSRGTRQSMPRAASSNLNVASHSGQ